MALSEKIIEKCIKLIASNSIDPVEVEIKYELFQYKLNNWKDKELIKVTNVILDRYDYFPSIAEFYEIHNDLFESESNGIPEWMENTEKEVWIGKDKKKQLGNMVDNLIKQKYKEER